MTSFPEKVMGQVEDLIRTTELEVIRPRFSALRADEVNSKSPGEVVTVADVEAERLLAHGLSRIAPGVPVVGEEACSSEPGLLDALQGERAWLVDPIDGTANFVAGKVDWAVMVAFVERGRTVASWIWVPMRDTMYVARSGGGATRNGSVLRSASPPPEGDDPGGAGDSAGATARDSGRMTGAVLTRFLDGDTAARVEAHRHRFASVTAGRLCAGVDYPDVVEGGQHFVLFWRTLPWDHAPGVLLVREAGGAVARLDGVEYQPSRPGTGLLVASDQQTWSTVRATLLGDGASARE